jgi:molybdate transport repressor ModE-like protein
MQSSRRYFKELRFRQLRSLVALARRGSFSAVAEAFRISVPSVWQQIRALEEEFGTVLVRRSGKAAALTEQGELLVELVRPLVEGFDNIRELFTEQKRLLPCRITVATTASLLLHELQRPLAVLRERHPDIELTFIDRPSVIALKHLENGDADIAVLGTMGEQLPSYIHSTVLTAYPFVLVCPEGHPLQQARSIRLPDILKYPLVMPGEGSNSRLQVQRVLEAAGMWQDARVAFTASTFDIVAGYVRSGFGIAVTSVSPLLLAEAEAGSLTYRGIVFRDLSKLFREETVILAHRHAKIELPHHRTFREVVIGNFPEAAR